MELGSLGGVVFSFFGGRSCSVFLLSSMFESFSIGFAARREPPRLNPPFTFSWGTAAGATRFALITLQRVQGRLLGELTVFLQFLLECISCRQDRRPASVLGPSR